MQREIMTAKRLTILPTVAVLLATVVFPGCSRSAPLADVSVTRAKMGNVPVTIRTFGPDEKTCNEAIEAAFKRIDELNAMLSDYVDGSDVSRINKAAGGDPQRVSSETLSVVKFAKGWWKKTSGAFDPTIRPALILWRIASRDDEMPADEDVEAERELIGADKIEIDEAEHTVRLAKEGMSLDLGGIAKGYIVDQAIAVLREHGIRSATVDAGGDIYLLGCKPAQAGKPGGESWSVGVENPPPRDEPYSIVLNVTDAAVATSGGYRRNLYIEDKRYSHIIDPRTGRPAEHVASATVIAPDLTTADALATALCVLGPDDGIKIIDNLDATEALILSRNNAILRAAISKNFVKYVNEGLDTLVEMKNGKN